MTIGTLELLIAWDQSGSEIDQRQDAVLVTQMIVQCIVALDAELFSTDITRQQIRQATLLDLLSIILTIVFNQMTEINATLLALFLVQADNGHGAKVNPIDN